MRSRLPSALLLAAVITAGVTACGSGILVCACPASLVPVIVCGTPLNRNGMLTERVVLLSLNPRNGRVGRAPERSVIGRPATWAAAGNLTVYTITTGAKCTRAPLVTVKPVTAVRTLAVARGANGGIAGLTMAVISNARIVVRAYLGRHLVGWLAFAAQITSNAPPFPTATPAPAPPPARSPSPRPVPCGRLGQQGGHGAGPLYCLGPTAPAAS